MPNAGFLALCLVTLLALLGAADREAAIKTIPWASIMMVCGLALLISILAATVSSSSKSRRREGRGDIVFVAERKNAGRLDKPSYLTSEQTPQVPGVFE